MSTRCFSQSACNKEELEQRMHVPRKTAMHACALCVHVAFLHSQYSAGGGMPNTPTAKMWGFPLSYLCSLGFPSGGFWLCGGIWVFSLNYSSYKCLQTIIWSTSRLSASLSLDKISFYTIAFSIYPLFSLFMPSESSQPICIRISMYGRL